ncbi:MAG: family 10 glycosylhydrolase, partial [Planctomycetes bacterium]|nr:family 10 glycosylhydrolase [Planctomycetota bacterium]
MPFARVTTPWGRLLLLAIVLALSSPTTTVGQQTVRLRVNWGGPVKTLWRGVIAVSEGTLSEPRPLGMEADEPGSMWLDRGPVSLGGDEATSTPIAPEMDHLVIRSRSLRTYDGVDLLVTAAPEAKLLIGLSTRLPGAKPQWTSLPLADLYHDSHSMELDDRGSRLVVGRTPGDRLRVSLGRDSLVFSPGETLRFDVSPHLLPVAPDAKVRIETKLARSRSSSGDVVAESTVTAADRTSVSQEVRLPDEEGAYDLLLTATSPSWTNPVRGMQALAVRRIQLLVLRPEAPPAAPGSATEWSLVEEIDPANPGWWERLSKLPKLPTPSQLSHPLELSRLWKGPLGNGNSRTWPHPLGQLVQLGPSADAGDVAWEAYRLPISRPGQPHLLEIDYPSDVPQTIGVSIIESDLPGDVYPVGLDSGIELADEVAGTLGPPKWLHHRVVFWPKTKSPLVLITNRREGSPAVYGKIRVLTAGEHLPPFPAHDALTETPGNRAAEPLPTKRLLAAYLDRPLFPENFSASQSLASASQLGVDDWTTFYEGGTRMVEYLNHVGFGGLMVSVLADGSTLYPSSVVQPTPRYDTGAFQEAGQDPVRKDVLEMLFRLFDRQGLELIPAMEFAAPLPELEAELRRGGPGSQGILWVGAEGKTWLETFRPVREAAPYYNTLHPRVQEAMLAAIREVAKRYGHHPSFAGLAIQLSAQGYAQLPGPNWGMDDVTIARFEQETQIRVPGEGPGRFAERAAFLASQCPRQWL